MQLLKWYFVQYPDESMLITYDTAEKERISCMGIVEAQHGEIVSVMQLPQNLLKIYT